jgi:hypothetical protein
VPTPPVQFHASSSTTELEDLQRVIQKLNNYIIDLKRRVSQPQPHAQNNPSRNFNFQRIHKQARPTGEEK